MKCPDFMERTLLRKAYEQGRDFGLRGVEISQMDWEEEFLPEYNRGFKEGSDERNQPRLSEDIALGDREFRDYDYDHDE